MARKLIQMLRVEKGWSKAALARKAEIQQGVVGWIESGRYIPYDSQLRKLAEALDWQDDPLDLLKEVD